MIVSATIRFDLPAGDKDVEIWLPHYEGIVLMALRGDGLIGLLPE